MRFMLGTNNHPSLLVEVKELRDQYDFDFYVINGGWEGTFYNNRITVWSPYEPWTDLEEVEILTQNQDRLRCQNVDYEEVFSNFSNPNYVAPKLPFQDVPDTWDDDIPF